ncbi:MAG: D-alanine--D-alanine ligase family protein [Acidimicrobiia bacterium]
MTTTAVLFGGPSDEHDISILTGLQVARALPGEPVTLYWSKPGEWFRVEPDAEAADFVDGVPRKAREASFVAAPAGGFMMKKKPLQFEVALIACHGGPGEDGTLQGALDLARIRYTGPGQAASALGMDKFSFGAAMAAAGLPSLPRALVVVADEDKPGFDPPYIVKPRFGGSSIGIEVAADWDTVRALVGRSVYYNAGGVVEPFLEGSRDLQVGVRMFPEVELSAIEAPARAAGSGIYSYDQKYLAWGGEVSSGRQLPAEIDESLGERLRVMAEQVARVYGVRGIARIDFLEREGELWVNEINTIPGSMAAYLWIDPARDRTELFNDLVAEAAASQPRAYSIAGSDGTALRSAGTIASKLG